MRRLAWILAPALAAVAWLLLTRSSPPDRVDAKRATSEHDLVTRASPLIEQAEVSARRSAEPLAASAPVSEDFAPDTVAPLAGALRALRGTIQVFDPQGLVHPAEDGLMMLATWSAAGEEFHHVEVHGGAFHVDLRDDVTDLDFKRIDLGGRRAYRDVEEPFELGDAWDVAIAARWARDTILRVRDAVTGVDLTGLTVVLAEGWEQLGRRHPMPYREEQVLHRNAVSPIRLPTEVREPSWTCFVLAEGYAWGRIELAGGAGGGGERLLLLERGGSMVIEPVGEGRSAPAVIRLRPVDSTDRRAAVEVQLEGQERIIIDGVAPGTLRVTAEIGRWYEDSLVLGETQVEVVAGRQSRVTLAVAAPPAVELVPMGGVLVLPVEWQLADFGLMFTRLGGTATENAGELAISRRDMSAVEGKPWLYRFDAGLVQTGQYRAVVRPLEYVVLVAIGAAGERDLRIEVPGPGNVTVRLFHEITGAQIVLPHLRWACRRPLGLSGGSFETVEVGADGTFEFAAPQGGVELQVFENGFEYRSEMVEVGPGSNAFRLALRPSCGVEFELFDGDERVPRPKGLDVEVGEVAGDGEATTWSWTDFGMRITVSHPGRYQLNLGPVPGYQPVPSQEVLIPAGEIIHHKVQLTSP